MHDYRCASATTLGCTCECGGKGHGRQPIPGTPPEEKDRRMVRTGTPTAEQWRASWDVYDKPYGQLKGSEKAKVDWYISGQQEGKFAAEVNLGSPRDRAELHGALVEGRLGEVVGEVREHQVQMAGDISYEVGKRGGPTVDQYSFYEDGFTNGFEETVKESYQGTEAQSEAGYKRGSPYDPHGVKGIPPPPNAETHAAIVRSAEKYKPQDQYMFADHEGKVKLFATEAGAEAAADIAARRGHPPQTRVGRSIGRGANRCFHCQKDFESNQATAQHFYDVHGFPD